MRRGSASTTGSPRAQLPAVDVLALLNSTAPRKRGTEFHTKIGRTISNSARVDIPPGEEVTQLVWFRRDLRLEDNPAWSAATRTGSTVAALFVIDPTLWDRVTERRRTQLGGHLNALDVRLRSLGGALRVAHGRPDQVVPALARDIGALQIHVNCDVSPFSIERDRLVARSAELTTHHGVYVHPAGSVTKADGTPYQVFTPFWKTWSLRAIEPWQPAAETEIMADEGDGIPSLGSPPTHGGSEAALDHLDAFESVVDDYQLLRNRPDLDATSRLSSDLKWGTLSPRTVLERIGDHTEGRRSFIRQLAWRDFNAHLLLAFPRTIDTALKPAYDNIQWVDDPEAFTAWTRGETGFPIVDAGMRQLRAEGFIHNRVRLLVASFLVKDLLIDWRKGERFFRRHLLDADVAQNVANWQWVAGTGADAAPYFRVFNPTLQSVKFDPDGTYIRRWLPELRGLEGSEIHAPVGVTTRRLEEAGVILGVNYPIPIVDHSFARQRAIEAYSQALTKSHRRPR